TGWLDREHSPIHVAERVNSSLTHNGIFASRDVAVANVLGIGAGIKPLVVMTALQCPDCARANAAGPRQMPHVTACARRLGNTARLRFRRQRACSDGRSKSSLSKQNDGSNENDEESNSRSLGGHLFLSCPRILLLRLHEACQRLYL